MTTLTPKLRRPKLSQAIRDDLGNSDLVEQDALELGWYQDAKGNLAMPYNNGSGLVRTRFTVPQLIERNGKQSFLRYLQPRGTPPELYLPTIGDFDWGEVKVDASIRLYITEGEKKSAIACKRGLPCIGLSGVDSWSRKGGIPLPQWDEFDFNDREVVIAFDSDIADKPAVKSAERRLAQMLNSRKAKVYRLRMSEEIITGFDDFMNSTHSKGSK
ncbi:DUF3854 domain-containing protein [Polynucleobacter sp. JS-Safj-400b-B2]|uniref:DUF3854 domain-containing protein n=1 Tax=Polynucleobacter sp. JS-Safj-400b-B2 TaxID=2576921 RepID=UPI001C0AE23A|nr:DUF3854 domain-containing protein [Polynucleobacter sp. JS-Safj-400b-B2]MBU3624766.1 DUF3854 domain-containing protein [Polynucleobacter sp. JS-Safj-400b-B2]